MKHFDSLTVRVGTSRREVKLRWLMHAMALLAIALSAMEPAIKGMLIAVVALSAIAYRRWHLVNDAELVLRNSEDYGWQIICADQCIPIRILGSTVLTPFVICLHYQSQNKIYYRVIFNDAMDENEFRRLNVYLKISGPAEPRT